MVTIPRTVVATLKERYIFNFRLPPDKLAERLPVDWLKPQIINGWSVASFCILSLRNVMVWPIPSQFGFKTISCAYRCGAIDHSGSEPTPSVYVLDRNTDLPLIARLAPFLFLDTIPMVDVELSRAEGGVKVNVRYLDRQRMFAAKARPLPGGGLFESKVFESLDGFAQFIHQGISSYTPSIFGDSLARVDLHKEDPVYEPMAGEIDYDWLEGEWRDAHLEFDSAVRATGGLYRWTFRGVRSELPSTGS